MHLSCIPLLPVNACYKFYHGILCTLIPFCLKMRLTQQFSGLAVNLITLWLKKRMQRNARRCFTEGILIINSDTLVFTIVKMWIHVRLIASIFDSKSQKCAPLLCRSHRISSDLVYNMH